MRYIFVFFIFINSLTAFSIDMKDKNIANGATGLVEISKEKGIKYLDVLFDKRKFPIFKDSVKKDKYIVLLPISYYASLGKKRFKVEYLQNGIKKTKSFYFSVIAGKYKKEQIKVSNKKVNPKSLKVKKRISLEYAEAMNIYKKIDKKNYLHKYFIVPLSSKITSPFGTARIYNGSLKGYHSGTDFRAKMHTPIRASNDGKVVLVKKRFYSGGTVIIDHGHGIYTCYFHMSKFKVKKGEFVKRKQVIGLSGKSGRVTGPHLHFSVRVYGVQVDPLQFIKLLNNNILQDK